MEVQFFYNYSDDRKINKFLQEGETFIGELREQIDVMRPIIRFDKEDVLRYNYAYVPELQRYYIVTDRTAFRDGLWDISFEVDVLMSFRGDIGKLQVIVDKQSMPENGDEYIDDGSLVSDNVTFQTIYKFQNGFNDYGEYILITAG